MNIPELGGKTGQTSRLVGPYFADVNSLSAMATIDEYDRLSLGPLGALSRHPVRLGMALHFSQLFVLEKLSRPQAALSAALFSRFLERVCSLFSDVFFPTCQVRVVRKTND